MMLNFQVPDDEFRRRLQSQQAGVVAYYRARCTACGTRQPVMAPSGAEHAVYFRCFNCLKAEVDVQFGDGEIQAEEWEVFWRWNPHDKSFGGAPIVRIGFTDDELRRLRAVQRRNGYGGEHQLELF